jgi:hypothetical protein
VSQNTGSLLAIDSETGHILRQLKIPVASGGLSFHNDTLWLGVAKTMTFNEQTRSFSWVSDELRYAVVELSPIDGQEINRYAIEFLPLGITWIEDVLWLTEPSKGKLHRGRLS